ncbi:MAG: AMP-binding protein [Actinomycetota bacterium]
MPGLPQGLKPILEIADPKVGKRLVGAGMLSIKTPLAIATALPWLIGRGQSLGIVSQMNAVSIGHKPALHDRNGTMTWRELDQASNRVARAYEKAGLQPAAKVGLLLRNGREMSAAALGAQKSGMITCPFNTWAKPKELRAVVEGTDPEVLFYDTAHSDQVKACATEQMTLVHVGDPAAALDGSVSFEEFIAGCSTSALSPMTDDRGSPKIIIQTSGTTGTPKGASRDASATGLGMLAGVLASVPYHRDDVVLCPAPLFHSFGLATFTFGCVLGATLILPDRFDPEGCLQLIEKHKATAASFVPVMLRRIVSLPDEVKNRYDLSSLRIVMTSGSAVSVDLKGSATELFGEVLYDLYGSTEVGWVAIATPESIGERPRSVGRPVEGIEVGIFSGAGDRLPAGETGEIYIKSEIIFEGYTSGTETKVRDGYMSIGDLGRLDEDGYLYIESRADDMVVVGGENVYPIEIEETIESIPGVNEVTVLGVPDEEYGQVLAAFVVGSADEATILATCKEELASYKVPRTVKILDELPRTSTGKVLRRELIQDIDV